MTSEPSCEFRSDTDVSLRVSAAPIAWANGRSPRSVVSGRGVVLVDHEGDNVIARRVRQDDAATIVTSTIPSARHAAWLDGTFRAHDISGGFEDPVIRRLAERFPNLHSFTDGSLFAGLITSIVGQSISIASAMAVQRRLALSFDPGIPVDGRLMAPLPSAGDLADASLELIRASGVTWKRAEGLKAIATEEAAGNLPSGREGDLAVIQRELLHLPSVGPWTAASALLWGIGADDAWPKGDVALLRAARLAYDRDGMTMRDLDALSDSWRPYRAVAARLLWTGLLGPAWD